MEPAARQRGFTLIELLVTLGVVALMAAAALPALRGVSGANARQAAGELSGALRYLFDTAALRHTTCRMALDLEHHAWWAECGQGAQAVARDTDRRRGADTSLEDRFPDEKDADRRRLLAKTSFGEFTDRLVARRELPGSVTLGEIRVEGRSSPIATGVAYVHFFAGGQAQRAFIPVVDGTTVYTVVVEPFSGRARVAVGRVDEELK